MKFAWMKKALKGFASVAIVSSLPFSSVQSAFAQDEINETLQYYAYGKGNLIEGIEKLEKILATTDERDKALFAIGMLDFLKALQGLQRDLYRYGAGRSPFEDAIQEAMASDRNNRILPFFRVTVPYNPKPEQINYENAREILEVAVAGFENTQASLDEVKSGDFKLELDLLKIAYDINEDGKIGEYESLESVFNSVMFDNRNFLSMDLAASEKIIRFDSADVSWLQGYSNLLAGTGKFFLAFDFNTSYEATFHTVFGEQATAFGRKMHLGEGTTEQINLVKEEIAKLNEKANKIFSPEMKNRLTEIIELRNKIYLDKSLSDDERKQKFAKFDEEYKVEQDALTKSEAQVSLVAFEIRRANGRLAKLEPLMSSRGDWTEILDAVGYIHSINWPIENPDVLRQSREHFVKVMQLNYQTWDLVQKETDDDHEWLPNANQTSPFAQMEVTQELIDEWLTAVKQTEKVFEGELLVPSMRFGKGINLKTFFETADGFDFVLFITGQDSINYLQEGPIWDESMMEALNLPLGGDISRYAMWFN